MIIGVVVLVVVLLIIWLVWKKMMSCKEDSQCNNGKCVNHKCMCDSGYKGAHCKDKVSM